MNEVINEVIFEDTVDAYGMYDAIEDLQCKVYPIVDDDCVGTEYIITVRRKWEK